MAQKNRNSFAFDDNTYARMTALADVNFSTPVRGGNSAALVRHLVNQAWLDPQKFGLVPPPKEVVKAVNEGETGRPHG